MDMQWKYKQLQLVTLSKAALISWESLNKSFRWFSVEIWLFPTIFINVNCLTVVFAELTAQRLPHVAMFVPTQGLYFYSFHLASCFRTDGHGLELTNLLLSHLGHSDL